MHDESLKEILVSIISFNLTGVQVLTFPLCSYHRIGWRGKEWKSWKLPALGVLPGCIGCRSRIQFEPECGEGVRAGL